MEPSPVCILIMGVSGSGKSHIGRALALAMGCHFIDGDDYHSASNIAKMSRGEPLNDEDRKEWLLALSALYRESHSKKESIIIGCSALKRRYREMLRQGAPDLRILYLHGSRETLLDRLTQRQSHFFHGEHMLDSQLEALEMPEDHEAIHMDIRLTPDTIVEQFLQHMRTQHAAHA